MSAPYHRLWVHHPARVLADRELPRSGTSGRVDKCMGTRGSTILMVSADANLPRIRYGL